MGKEDLREREFFVFVVFEKNYLRMSFSPEVMIDKIAKVVKALSTTAGIDVVSLCNAIMVKAITK